MSVCPFVRMEQLGFHWTDFHEIWHQKFPDICRQISVCIKSGREYSGTSSHDQHIYIYICMYEIIWRSFILRRRNLSDESCREIQNTHFVFKKRVPKIVPLMWVGMVQPDRPHATLTFWRRNYFFFILAHFVYKMWIVQEPNKLELWNKLHFKEKKRRVYIMFKIFGTYICWINI